MSEGYREEAQGGPRVRTDIVDAYLFRRPSGASSSRVIELLQLMRAHDPLGGTWQPIMGHVEAGETAWGTVVREVREEVGLAIDGDDARGFWALEQVHPFYLAELDCIVMSPRFVIEVSSSWEPTLNDEHTDHRWIGAPLHGGLSMREFFLWPGQRRAVEEILEMIVPRDAAAREHLRVNYKI